MPIADEIAHRQRLLAVNRRNLALLLQQAAAQRAASPVGAVTPIVSNSMLLAREQIAKNKDLLRSWGVAVDDERNDVALA